MNGEEKENVSRKGLKNLEKISKESSAPLAKEQKEWQYTIKPKIEEYLTARGYKRDEPRFESDWLGLLKIEFGLSKDRVISSGKFTSDEIKKIDDYRFKIEGDLMRRTNFFTTGTISQGPNPYAIPDSVVRRIAQERLEKLDNILHMWDTIAAVGGLVIGAASLAGKGGRIRDTSSGSKHQPTERSLFVPGEMDIKTAIETGKEIITHVDKKALGGGFGTSLKRIPKKPMPQSRSTDTHPTEKDAEPEFMRHLPQSRTAVRDLERIKETPKGWEVASISETDVKLYRGFQKNVEKFTNNPIKAGEIGGQASRKADAAHDAVFNQYGKDPILDGPDKGGVIAITIPKDVWNEMVKNGHISERPYPGFSGNLSSSEIRINSKKAADIINKCDKEVINADPTYDHRPETLLERTGIKFPKRETPRSGDSKPTREIKKPSEEAEAKSEKPLKPTDYPGKEQVVETLRQLEDDPALKAWRDHRRCTAKEFEKWLHSLPEESRVELLQRLKEGPTKDSIGNRNFVLRDGAHDIRVDKGLEEWGIPQKHGDFVGRGNKAEKPIADAMSSTKKKGEDPELDKKINVHNEVRPHHNPEKADDFLHQALDIYDAVTDPLRTKEFGGYRDKVMGHHEIRNDFVNNVKKDPIAREAMKTILKWKEEGGDPKKLRVEYHRWFSEIEKKETSLKTEKTEKGLRIRESESQRNIGDRSDKTRPRFA